MGPPASRIPPPDRPTRPREPSHRPYTRADLGAVLDDFASERLAKPLKKNGIEKRRKTRQKSSELVKAGHKPLISHVFQ
jgi:hypothetical protein